MASAIEIYKQAYDLDYRHGDLSYAETLYKEIIRDFPDSVEREYAEVHLDRIEKLRKNPNSKAFKSVVQNDGTSGFVIFNFALTLIFAVVLGYILMFFFSVRNENISNNFVISGLIEELNGKKIHSAELYSKAILKYPKNISAHKALAYAYTYQKDKKMAELSYYEWKKLSPNDIDLDAFRNKFKRTFGVEPRGY